MTDECDTVIVACSRCGAPIDTLWEPDGGGMLPNKEHTLIGDSVFHEACWNRLVEESPPNVLDEDDTDGDDPSTW